MKSDRLARVEEGDSNQTAARGTYRAEHHAEKTRDLLDRDEAVFVHQSLSTPCLNVLRQSSGASLIDVEGRGIVDLHGNGVHVLGFSHPAVVAAVMEQLQRLPFSTRRYTNEPIIRLAEKLTSLLPDGPWRVLFMPAGSLAVGAALKTARLISGKYKAVGMWGAFHGASLDAISVGGERMFRDHMGPLLPGTLHVHPWTPGRSVDDAVDEIEKLFRVEGDVGALIAEPVRWSTITIPPVEYWQRVRALCDRYGVMLIFDEIGTCMGRTGKWFAFEHFTDVVPDIVVMGKALGAGVLPLAAMLVKASIADPQKTHDVALGHFTHEKNPLAASAALAAIEVIEREHLIDRANQVGGELLRKLKDKLAGLAGVVAVRGVGMMFAIELADEEHAERVMYACLRRGISFKVSSGRVLTLVAPLTLSTPESNWIVEQFEEVIRQTHAAPDAADSVDAGGVALGA
jgi:4-aminobutyrate aminotransferase